MQCLRNDLCGQKNDNVELVNWCRSDWKVDFVYFWSCSLVVLPENENKMKHELVMNLSMGRAPRAGPRCAAPIDPAGRPNQQLLRNRAARPIRMHTKSNSVSSVEWIASGIGKMFLLEPLSILRRLGKISAEDYDGTMNLQWVKIMLFEHVRERCRSGFLFCLSMCGSDVGRGFYFHFWKKSMKLRLRVPTVLCQWDLNEDSKWCALKLACHFYVVCPQATV